MAPSVSVVIPAYNSSEFLEEAVESALKQTHEPDLVIVVDDESQDDSFALAKKLASANSKVRAINRTNGGACAARNTGLGLSNTDFVQFLDADDRLLPDAIERHLIEFGKYPKSLMVFGSNYVISADGERVGGNLTPSKNVTLEELAMCVTPAPSQCLYRASILREIGGFNETLRPGDEIDLNIRLARLGEIRSHPYFVMEYRRHPNQGTKDVYAVTNGHLKALELNFGRNSATPDAALLRRARRKWMARYGNGQHMAAIGAIRHGRFREILPAIRLVLGRAWSRALGAE